MTTATKVEVHRVLGANKKTLKKQKGWRLDADLAQYLEKRGEVSGEVNVVEDCIRLHRTLSEVLDGKTSQLVAYAKENGMVMRDHESAVIARLVLLGLDAHERAKKK